MHELIFADLMHPTTIASELFRGTIKRSSERSPPRKGSLCNRNPPKTKTKKRLNNALIAVSVLYAALKRWRFAVRHNAPVATPSAKPAAKVEGSNRFLLPYVAPSASVERFTIVVRWIYAKHDSQDTIFAPDGSHSFHCDSTLISLLCHQPLQQRTRLFTATGRVEFL